MLTKRAHEYVNESWEERAFAKDAAGLLFGGCVWPPRSYTCTFCRREFRSAQALGGHMNVHRRERAIGKQFSSSPNDQPPIHTNYVLPNCHTFPNHGDGQTPGFADDIPIPNVINGATSTAAKPLPTVSITNDSGKCRRAKVVTGCKDDRMHNDDNSSIFLSLRFQRDVCISAEDVPIHKRRKLDILSTQAVNYEDQSTEDEQNIAVLKLAGLRSSSLEELDLELRLGENPKVQQKCYSYTV